jgi:hypothetical protein
VLLAKGEQALGRRKAGGGKGGKGLVKGIVLVAPGEDGKKVPEKSSEGGERSGEELGVVGLEGRVSAPEQLELVALKGVVLKDGALGAREGPGQDELVRERALSDGEGAEVVGKRVDVLSATTRKEMVLLGESGAGKAGGEELFGGEHV